LTELLQNINGIVIFKHGVKALFTEDELNWPELTWTSRPSYSNMTRSLVTRASVRSILRIYWLQRTRTVSARLVLNACIPVWPFTSEFMNWSSVQFRCCEQTLIHTSIVDGDPVVAADWRLVDDGPVIMWGRVYRVPRDRGTWYTDVMTAAQYQRPTLGDGQRLDAAWQGRVLEHCTRQIQPSVFYERKISNLLDETAENTHLSLAFNVQRLSGFSNIIFMDCCNALRSYYNRRTKNLQMMTTMIQMPK